MQRKQSNRTITAVNPLGSASRRPPARLYLVHPRDARRRIDLLEGIIAFGRGAVDAVSELFVELPDDTVSRSHFAMAWVAAENTWVIKDLGSRNGTWLDGVKVGQEFLPVTDNAVIRAGHVVFVFEVGEEPAGSDDAQVSTQAIPGQAAATRALRASIARAARDPSPALIVGETGVGKELIAGEIHRLSGRAGALVAINCAALSRELVESQLFGHERGAFTGAHDTHAGYFRAAQGGTLFLDEIGELPLDLQPKLLRAIEEGTVHPVGSTRTIRVDARIVAATNRDLGRLVDEGGFRRDLYARISLWEIAAPPLSKRRADIAGWLDVFHDRWLAARGLTAARCDLDALAIEAILRGRWRENLRGLDRLTHELASRPPQEAPLAPNDLPAWVLDARPSKAPTSADPRSGEPRSGERTSLPPPLSSDAEPSASAGLREKTPAPTREELIEVLKRLGSVRAAAKHFERDRRQIYRWIQSHGIRDDEL